jgi:hypothetical protein
MWKEITLIVFMIILVILDLFLNYVLSKLIWNSIEFKKYPFRTIICFTPIIGTILILFKMTSFFKE